MAFELSTVFQPSRPVAQAVSFDSNCGKGQAVTFRCGPRGPKALAAKNVRGLGERRKGGGRSGAALRYNLIGLGGQPFPLGCRT